MNYMRYLVNTVLFRLGIASKSELRDVGHAIFEAINSLNEVEGSTLVTICDHMRDKQGVNVGAKRHLINLFVKIALDESVLVQNGQRFLIVPPRTHARLLKDARRRARHIEDVGVTKLPMFCYNTE